jgi:hypothetical protein
VNDGAPARRHADDPHVVVNDGTPARLRWLLSALLIVGAALFAVGTTVERNADDHAEDGATHTEEGEPAGEHADEHTAVGRAHDESSEERVLGMNLESPLLIGLAVAVSVALAVFTWRSNAQFVLLAAVGFAALFAVFDVVELAHQIHNSRSGIAVLVATVALVHATAALVAQLRVSKRAAVPSATPP